jgi:AcrR family transcriptional regulator
MPTRAQAAVRKPATRMLRPELPREYVASYKRKRIMEAIAKLTAEKGYEATKIADIVRQARVARKTLYDNFEGKEEVFLAAFDSAVEEAMARVEAECARVEGDWEQRVEAGLAAFLGYVAEEPALARMCMIEALSATPASSERYGDAMQRFVELIERRAPHEDRRPETTWESAIGGVAWIVYQQIRRGETEKAMDLLPGLSKFVLGPGAASEERARARDGALADSST